MTITNELLNFEYIDEVMVLQDGSVKSELEPSERLHTYKSPSRIPTEGVFTDFYRYAVEQDTIYIKVGCNVTHIKSDSLIRLLNFRIDNPKYFLVFSKEMPGVFSFMGKELSKCNGLFEVYLQDDYSKQIYRDEVETIMRNMALCEEEWLYKTYPARQGLKNFTI